MMNTVIIKRINNNILVKAQIINNNLHSPLYINHMIIKIIKITNKSHFISNKELI